MSSVFLKLIVILSPSIPSISTFNGVFSSDERQIQHLYNL
jgi:hypothetical protein